MLLRTLDLARWRVFTGLRAAALVFLCGAGYCQPEASPQKFEVASVKPSRPGAKGAFDISPSGTVNLNTTVRSLILMAYQIQDYRLAGGPKWLDSDYYYIAAKPPSGPIPSEQSTRTNQTSERLRYLLAERFQLTVHHETRNLQEYVLVVAKSGPRLKEMEHDAANFRLSLGKGKIATRGGAKIGMLVNVLANTLHYPVVDKTGLDRYYDIQLNYSVDESLPDAGPSIFAALEEQLGLKLEARKGPIDVVVIDRVERPSED
jgi:uncharacterized protein (TIGR03435 family)